MMTRAALAVLAGCAMLPACVAVPIVGGSALLGRGVMQERSTFDGISDANIELGVLNRLGNHSGELYRDVWVDATEGRVVLTGSVPRAGDRVAATEAAWATPGVVAVEDALTVAKDSGTLAYLEDVSISNQVRARLLGDFAVRAINYSVTTVDRTVHLTGLARTRTELARVIDLAREVPGVVKVVSHVRTVDDPDRVSRLAKGG